MTGPETQETTAKAGTPFRVDVQLHDLLMKSGSNEKLSPALQPRTETLSLPTPPYPQRAYERVGFVVHEAQYTRPFEDFIGARGLHRMSQLLLD